MSAFVRRIARHGGRTGKSARNFAPLGILERYIALSLAQGWCLALLALGAVFWLVGLIDEMDGIHGDYGVARVLLFTLMTLPTQLLELSPVVFLLGTIAALAGLQRGNELTIVCCSGASALALLRALCLPSLALMAGLWAALEYLAPPLHLQAQRMKAAARQDHPDRLPDGGVWSRHGNRVIHLGELREDGRPGAIRLYQFDDGGALALALAADSATVGEDRRWRFARVRRKEPVAGQLSTGWRERASIDNLWSAAELPSLPLTARSMSLTVLSDYTEYLKASQQAHADHEMALWRRLALPVTVAAMILLATPVSATIGSRRGRDFGVNMAAGALIGIFFFLGAQITYSAGRMLQADPALTALLPALAVALCGAWLISRMRW